jgi:aspartate/methionine/tyrosine aminotransferase
MVFFARPVSILRELQDLKAQMRPNTKLVVVNFPHNPTGFIPTRAEFQQIVDLCRERGAYLFCDEMYR